MKIFFLKTADGELGACITPDFMLPQEVRNTHEGSEILGDHLELEPSLAKMAEDYLGTEIGPVHDRRSNRLCYLIKIGMRRGKAGRLTEGRFLEIMHQMSREKLVMDKNLSNQFLSLGFREGAKVRRQCMAISR